MVQKCRVSHGHLLPSVQRFCSSSSCHPEPAKSSSRNLVDAKPGGRMSERHRLPRDQTWDHSMAIRFRNKAQAPIARLQGSKPNANAATMPSISSWAPGAQATFSLREHIIGWLILLFFVLLYLHIGHRLSFEPAAFYETRLFWRSLAAETSRAIAKFALWIHSICEKFQI